MQVQALRSLLDKMPDDAVMLVGLRPEDRGRWDEGELLALKNCACLFAFREGGGMRIVEVPKAELGGEGVRDEQ